MHKPEDEYRKKATHDEPRIIAFYLPQFHPIPENDEWWGKGFTEWFNVGRAKPLFWGHKQPKVPTALGYYDLRVPEIREAQAQLAQEAGIEGFCYWHYWFGNGKRLLERPIEEVVKTGRPDFPFCLAWANESWKLKTWDKNGNDRLLIRQEYGGIEDYTQHFYTILPILTDKRYIKINGKCLFMIYRSKEFDDCHLFIEIWKKLAVENGLKGIHFVAHTDSWEKEYKVYFDKGFDAVYTNRVMSGTLGLRSNNIWNITKSILFRTLGLPRIINFKTVTKQSYNQDDCQENYYPGIICNWDHSPRSGRKGYVFTNFNRVTFMDHVRKQLSLVENKNYEKRIIFLKSWNEWGEGNFMEPDYHDGDFKLNVLKSALQKIRYVSSSHNT